MNILKKPEIIIFILIVLFSLFFRIKIIHALPLGTTTTKYGLLGFDDEPAYFNYTNYIQKAHQLPVEKHAVSYANAFKINEFEYYQPPLYYLSVFAICELYGVSNPASVLLIGRYLNMFITLLSFYIIYLIFTQIGWEKEKSITGLLIISLLGCHVYQTSLYGNDPLSWFLIWWIFLTNILVIYPVLLWAFYFELKKGSEKVTQKSIFIILSPLVAALPWYICNYQLYNSFLLLSGSQWHFVSTYFESLTNIVLAPYTFLFRMHFKPPKTLLSIFNYLQYLFVFALTLAGIWKSVKSIKHSFYILVFILMLLTMLVAYLWLVIPTGSTEGRMLFPALPAIIYFICQPLFDLAEKFKLKTYINLIL